MPKVTEAHRGPRPLFLQWLVVQYRGEPRSRGERWMWHECPVCTGHGCFCTQPVGANGKQRYKCFALDAFGDAFDVLILCGGALMQDFGHRCVRMVDLLRQYIAQHGTEGVPMDVVQTLVGRGYIEGLHTLTGNAGDAALLSWGSSATEPTEAEFTGAVIGAVYRRMFGDTPPLSDEELAEYKRIICDEVYGLDDPQQVLKLRRTILDNGIDPVELLGTAWHAETLYNDVRRHVLKRLPVPADVPADWQRTIDGLGKAEQATLLEVRRITQETGIGPIDFLETVYIQLTPMGELLAESAEKCRHRRTA